MILVAGGTGRLGSTVVASLLTGGHEVRVLARGTRPSPDGPEGAEMVAGSVCDPAVVARAVAGVDVVVSSVTGFPSAPPGRVDVEGSAVLSRAAARAGARLVLVSVAGASATSPMELFRAKDESERAVRRSDVAWTIIRPDAFADLWIELLSRTARRTHRPVVLGRGGAAVGWVAVRDVAALTVRAVETPSLRDACLTITGPQRLTVTELAAEIMTARGWPGTPRHVPTGILHLAAHLPGAPGRLTRAAVAMEALPPAVDDARGLVPDLPCTPVSGLLQPDDAAATRPPGTA